MSIEATIKARILPHQHSDSQWAVLDCWLGSGEEGFNTTNRKKKTGPGHWNSLPYDEVGGGTGSGPANTDELPEGSTNRYFTDARADARANARIAAADLVPKAATSTAGFAFVDNDETLAAGSATKLASQRAVRLFVLAKFAELIAAAPAELDTWLELVAAIQENEDAFASIVTALAGKLATTDAPELIRDTIAAALVPGVNVTITPNDVANTITIASAGAVAPLVFDEVDGWPARPDVDYPVFWVGGEAPEDFPPEHQAHDVWFDANGFVYDMGTILEAFSLIAGTANTIPYLSALNTFGNLLFKTIMSASPSDTTVLSEAAIKTYVDKLLVSTKTESYAFVATDVGRVIEYNSTANGTFTLNAGIMSYGDVIEVRSINTGILTIAGSGVVAAGNRFKLTGQWSGATLHCREAGSYVLAGDLTA